jgi:hypothetical protein
MTPLAEQPAMIADVLRRALNRGVWRDMVRLLDDRLELDLTAGPEQTEMVLSDADRAILLPALRYGAHDAAIESLLAESQLTPEARRLTDFGQAPVLLDDLLAALQTANTTTALMRDPSTQEAVQPLNQAVNQGAVTDATQDAFASEIIIDSRPHPIVDFAAYEARLETAGQPLKAFMRRELAVYHGLQFDLPPALQNALALPPDDGPKTRLDRLADNKWVGDLLLALVANYAGTPPGQLSVADIATLLSSLRRVGLDTTAAQLGDEILTLAMAELSLAAPEKLIAGPQEFATPFDAPQ